MAIEKEVNYKVQLDESDLVQKLTRIQSDINSALAGQSFGGGGISVSNAPPTYGSLPPIPQHFTGAAFGIADQTFGATYNRFSNDLQMAQGTVYQTLQRAQQSVQTAQLTLQNTMDKVGTNFRSPQFVSPSDNFMGISGDEGWFKNILGAGLGVGYNPDTSLSPGMYREMSGHRLAYNAPNMFGSLAGFGLGFLGAGGGPLGMAVGLAAGFVGKKTIGAGMNMFLAPTLQDMQTADYVNMSINQRSTLLSRQGNQGVFTGVGSNVASRMSEYVKSSEGFITGVSRSEAEQALRSFTEMGGFDSSRTSDEYLRKFDDMLEGHKKIMHAFRTSQQKALQYMTDMEQAGLSSSTGTAMALQAIGQSVGLQGSQLVDFGLQTQKLAFQALPGVSTTGGFTMGISSLLTAQSLAREGVYDNEFIARMGGGQEGIQNIANSLLSTAFSAARTPLGRMQLLAGQGGLGADPFRLLTAGVSNISNLNDAMNFASGVDIGAQMEELGPMNMTASVVQNSIKMMDKAGFLRRGAGGTYSSRDVTSYLMQTQGMSYEQATAALMLGKQEPTTEGQRFNNALAERIAISQAEEPSSLAVSYANMQSALTGFSEDWLRPAGAGAIIGGTLAIAGGLAIGALSAPLVIGGLAVGAAAGLGAYAGMGGRDGVTYQYEKMMRSISDALTGTDRSKKFDPTVLQTLGMKPKEEKAAFLAGAELLKQEMLNQTRAEEVAYVSYGVPIRYAVHPNAIEISSSTISAREDSLTGPVEKRLLEMRKEAGMSAIIPVSGLHDVAKAYLMGKSNLPSSVTGPLDQQFGASKDVFQQINLIKGQQSIRAAEPGVFKQFGLEGMTTESFIKSMETGSFRPTSTEQEMLVEVFGGLRGNDLISSVNSFMALSSGKNSIDIAGDMLQTRKLSGKAISSDLLNYLRTNVDYDNMDSKQRLAFDTFGVAAINDPNARDVLQASDIRKIASCVEGGALKTKQI